MDQDNSAAETQLISSLQQGCFLQGNRGETPHRRSQRGALLPPNDAAQEWPRANRVYPRILGIDEHRFTRRQGFATTFCDLARCRVFDVIKGRSATDMRDFFYNRCKAVIKLKWSVLICTPRIGDLCGSCLPIHALLRADFMSSGWLISTFQSSARQFIRSTCLCDRRYDASFANSP